MYRYARGITAFEGNNISIVTFSTPRNPNPEETHPQNPSNSAGYNKYLLSGCLFEFLRIAGPWCHIIDFGEGSPLQQNHSSLGVKAQSHSHYDVARTHPSKPFSQLVSAKRSKGFPGGSSLGLYFGSATKGLHAEILPPVLLQIMSFGRITASLTSGIAEATATLLNVNLDFSLVKIEAPHEFSSVGAALSSLRRESAESGPVHTTARKLGALFEPNLPMTPNLIKAYGSRASEIARESEIKHHTNYGVFQSQVGIDATSIWASATSGEGSVKAHLLACILARVWDSSEATAIWDEIVESQKKTVMNRFNEGGQVDMVSWMVAKQKIDRKELRDWDASARAWLCIADKVKEEQQSRFWLALDHFDLKVKSRSGLYDGVMEMWKDILEGLELLVNGSSLELRTVNLLLGLSALHLYPDMDIVIKKESMVRQNDALVSGILTVGLSRNCTSGDAGIRWSLPLAHLQYYGNPIQRTRLVRTEGSRLTLTQFCQVLLGCILGGWGVDPRQIEVAVKWILKLDELIKDDLVGDFEAPFLTDIHKSWLSILSQAAQEYLYADEFDRRVFTRLIKLGYRKIEFLGKPEKPFFGFGDPEALLHLPSTVEMKIQILRAVAQKSKFSQSDVFIRYRPSPGAGFEFASAVPSMKRKLDEEDQPGHVRWLNVPQGGARPAIQQIPDGRYYYHHINQNGEMIGKETVRPLDCEIMRSFKLSEVAAIQWNRAGSAGRLNNFKFWLGDEDEVALFYAQDTISPPVTVTMQLSDIMTVFEEDQSLDGKILVAFDHAVQSVGTTHLSSLRAMTTMVNLYRMFLGASIDIRVIECPLSSRCWVKSTVRRGDDIRIFSPRAKEDVDLASDNEGIEQNAVPRKAHWMNTAYSPRETEEDITPTESPTEFQNELHMRLLAARKDDAPKGIIVEDVDSLSQQGEISSEGNALPIRYLGLQIPGLLAPFHLTRSESFACIILFESGQYDILPEKLHAVMAISSNDSLFIAGPMLCTPSEQPPSSEIHRVTGNIGQGGMALLISPADPRISQSANDVWTWCNHDPWDGEYIDHFGGTSLHLSYTGYNIPLDVGLQGAHDWEIYMLESVVSVHERGEWVADLDILRALQSPLLKRLPQPPSSVSDNDRRVGPGSSPWARCARHAESEDQASHGPQPSDLVAIQNWSEFLNRPESPVILLASSNWQAQLAATAIAIAQNHETYVIKDDSCSYCIVDAVEKARHRESVVCVA